MPTAWLVVERVVPVALVALSVPLLLLAVFTQLTEGAAWPLLLAGLCAWCGGIGWGVLAQDA